MVRPGAVVNWTEWTGFVNGPTQLHPFGGAGSKTPTGRVTGAPSFTHGPLCLHLGMLVHVHLWSIHVSIYPHIHIAVYTNVHVDVYKMDQVGNKMGQVGAQL